MGRWETEYGGQDSSREGGQGNSREGGWDSSRGGQENGQGRGQDSSQGRGQEFYSTREFSSQETLEYNGKEHAEAFGEPETGKEEDGGQNRKKKMHKIMQYFLGAVTTATLAAGISTGAVAMPVPGVELTEEEQAYLCDLEQYFLEEDYEGMLTPLIGGAEYDYDYDGRPRMQDDTVMAPVYGQIFEKAGWDEDEKMVLLVGEGEEVQAVPGGSGTGFCIKATKLYYGQIKDGLPDGEGTVYALPHMYYSMGKGQWSQGYVNGYAEFETSTYIEMENYIEYVYAMECVKGNYLNGRADGILTVEFKDLWGDYSEPMTEYEAREGRIVVGDNWESDRNGFSWTDSNGWEHYDDVHQLRWLGTATLRWLPVEELDPILP